MRLPELYCAVLDVEFEAKESVNIGPGARYRRLVVDGLEAFESSSVPYWAPPLEAKLCGGQEVALVGGGNSAGQAVVYLASHASKVWLLVRGPELAATMLRYLVDRIAGLRNVEVLKQTNITGLEGRDGILLAARKCAGRFNTFFYSSGQIRILTGYRDRALHWMRKALC